MSWFVAGGFPMVFIAVFGALALAGAARYAFAGGSIAPVLAYAASVGFASIAGVAADLAAVAGNVGRWEEELEAVELARLALVGCSEAMAPAILGFAVLAVVSLLTALGLRRRG